MNEFNDVVDTLKQMRDELRVQIHLASKDVQDDWEELEEKMKNITDKAGLDETGEGVGKAIEQLGQELKLGYERVRDAIKDT